MTIEYNYNEQSAVKADDAASRIAEPGPYVGKFVRVEAIKSERTGAQGIAFAFEAPGQGTTDFSLWTQGADGKPFFGMNMVNAIMFLLGVKSLKSVPGKVERYDEEAKARIEVDGDVFPDLCNKPIGIVLQKELYSKDNGGDGVRMNLYGLFQPETKLMMSEIKERKTTPVKLERLVKGLKVKDSRKARSDEPSQPSLGVATGDY